MKNNVIFVKCSCEKNKEWGVTSQATLTKIMEEINGKCMVRITGNFDLYSGNPVLKQKTCSVYPLSIKRDLNRIHKEGISHIAVMGEMSDPYILIMEVSENAYVMSENQPSVKALLPDTLKNITPEIYPDGAIFIPVDKAYICPKQILDSMVVKSSRNVLSHSIRIGEFAYAIAEIDSDTMDIFLNNGNAA